MNDSNSSIDIEHLNGMLEKFPQIMGPTAVFLDERRIGLLKSELEIKPFEFDDTFRFRGLHDFGINIYKTPYLMSDASFSPNASPEKKHAEPLPYGPGWVVSLVAIVVALVALFMFVSAQ